jgi:signal peptidase
LAEKAEGSSTAQSKSTVKELSKFVILLVVVIVGTYGLGYGLAFALGTEHPIRAVEGVSMEKTYFDGDLVVIRGIPTEDIKIGDVIVYQRTVSSIPIIHRVIDETLVSGRLYFITQGDNRISNPYPDSPVPAEAVKGVVIIHVPKLGFFFMVLQSPIGRVMSGVLIVIILLFEVFGEEDSKPKKGNPL